MNREEKIKKLEQQYAEQFAGNGYKNEFKPDGAMTECNFGGLLLILGNTGESVIVWRDWADNAIDDTLIECEIDYKRTEDEDFDGVSSFFVFQGTEYFLDNFMRL